MQSQEEASKLVQRVFLAPGTAQRRVVVFCGVGHGGGCTEVCARTADVLASCVDKSVCMIDGNFRTPSLHKYFDVDNQRGLTEMIAQSGNAREFARPVQNGSSMWLVSSGEVASDPHTLLRSDRLQNRIADLRAQFDYILIDSAPVTLYADAISLARLADGVILVIEANVTRREAARKAKMILEDAGVQLLGAVFNKRSFPIPAALYSRL
jgi:capsular exopolysaccharide synthesis family protein